MTVEEASRAFLATANRLPTLFDIGDEAVRLLTLCENVNDPELVAEFESELALIDQMMLEKQESYVSVIRSLEKMAEARKAEADRLRERAKTAERHADWLKARLLAHLQTTGQTRVETARFTLSIRQNPAAVQIVDEAAIPADYVIVETTYRINKRGILEAYKRDGVIPDGVEISRGERLSIA